MLKDEQGDVRYNAAWSLGTMGDISAAAPLVQALSDREDRTRSRAALSLTEIAKLNPDRLDEIVKPLIELLRSGDEPARSQSAWALQQITQQKFGEDYAGWKRWYDKSRKK